MRIALSEQSIDALAEVISGGPAGSPGPSVGLYRQGWRLSQFFGSFGIEFPLQGNSRVTATKAAVVSAVARPDADKVLKRIIERAADPRDFVHEPGKLDAVLYYLNGHLIFDDLKLEKHGLKVRLISTGQDASVIADLSSVIEEIDFDTVRRDFDRAIRSAEADPEDAITAACSVIESMCRSILVELGLPIPTRKDVSGLYQAVRVPLGLAPEKDGLPDEVETDVRSILGGLNTVVNGIGALRTHAGDAHGRERGYRRVDPRIARLAVHSASSVSLFLVETWQKKFPKRVLHKR
jgi:Abortive infection C-terminus